MVTVPPPSKEPALPGSKRRVKFRPVGAYTASGDQMDRRNLWAREWGAMRESSSALCFLTWLPGRVARPRMAATISHAPHFPSIQLKKRQTASPESPDTFPDLGRIRRLLCVMHAPLISLPRVAVTNMGLRRNAVLSFIICTRNWPPKRRIPSFAYSLLRIHRCP